MHNLLQADDVRVVAELLQDSDLPDGRAWNTIVAMVNLDLLDCNDCISGKL